VDIFDKANFRIGEIIKFPFSVAASYIHSIVSLGCVDYPPLSPKIVYEAAGIDFNLMQDYNYRLPLWKAFKLIRVGKELTKDPYLTLHLGTKVKAKTFQVLGYCCMSANTVGDAVDQLIRFEKLVWDVGNIKKVIRDGNTHVEWHAKGLPDAWIPQDAIDIAISGWVNFGYSITDHQYQPLAAAFRRAPPDDLSAYQNALKCPLLFNQSFNGIILSPQQTSLPLIDADPALQKIMQEQGEKSLSVYRDEINIVNEVRSVIFKNKWWLTPSFSDVAQALGMSDSNLKKNLAQANVKFKTIVDNIRKDLALHYFNNSNFTLLDITFLLGFSEQSAFNRAFKRWTSMSPRQFKRLTPASPSTP